MILETVFWTAAVTVGYAYLGYPLLAAAAARLRPRPRPAPAAQPRVSVIVAAYNEAPVIAAKVRSALEQDYPADRLEVLVVSDGSTDGTDDIVRRYPDDRVRLVRQDRAGKSPALNRGAALATGELLVFTDANALFAPGALARLVAGFADPQVGLVSGQGLYAGGDADAPRAVANGYARYEAFIKRQESRLGFVAGADGAVYALRRRLYRDLAPAHVNDLLHPIQAALAGYASRFDPRAVTLEPPSTGGGSEFRRHVRMIGQGFHVLADWLPRLAAARRWGPVWALLSHRLLRWLTAPCLLLALGASAALAAAHPLYRLAFLGQAGFYALAVAGLLAVPYYFCVVAAAGAAGLARYLRGGGDAVWAPRGQAAVEDRAA